MSDLKCPYLGCNQIIPLDPDIKECPNCHRMIRIEALAAASNRTIVATPEMVRKFVKNPEGKPDKNPDKNP